MSELRVLFGRRLQQLRRQKHLTEQLAEAAGISVDMLNVRRSTMLAHSAGLAAEKHDRGWYSTVEAVERYQAEVKGGEVSRGSPKSQ